MQVERDRRAKCFVWNCSNTRSNKPELPFHRFPRVPDRAPISERLKKWAAFAQPSKEWSEEELKQLFGSHKFLCSAHFDSYSYDGPRKLHRWSLPTIPASSSETALALLDAEDRKCDVGGLFEVVDGRTNPMEWKRKNDEAEENATKKLRIDQLLSSTPNNKETRSCGGSISDVDNDHGFYHRVSQSMYGRSQSTNNSSLGVTKLNKATNTTLPPLCTYWLPDKPYGELGKRRMESRTGGRCGNSARDLYERFSWDENNVGNEIDVDMSESKGEAGFLENREKPMILPSEKTDSTETALLKIFNACGNHDDNVFSCFVDPSKVPEYNYEASANVYCSPSSLNVIRSAAELCEFNDMKIKQLERLIGVEEETTTELEQILIKHLSSVMSLTGVKFLRKCFDQLIKEEMEKKKEKDNTRKKESGKPAVNSSPLIYSRKTKQFAVALQTMSGKAYHAMTKLMDLPPPSTAQSWATNQDGNPGFSMRGFYMLEREFYRKKKLNISLALEEVPLKRDVSWDNTQCFGYTDLGYGPLDYDYTPEATRAFVFFAVSLNYSWKIPLGYCLADDLSPAIRANLVMQYLYKLASTKAKCYTFICNYSVASYQMLVELGAISDLCHTPFTGSFPHPSKNERVHCFMDVHQVIKSINNLWAEKSDFFVKNNKISWDHMDRMNRFINSETRNPSLTAFHQDLQSLKHLIKKDPRSSYKYNTLAMAILKDSGLEGFENATDTFVFLDKLKSVAELFTSSHPQDSTQPVNKKNHHDTIEKLKSILSYFGNLKYCDGSKIMESSRKLPFVALMSNLSSLKQLIRKFISLDKFKLANLKTELLGMDGVNQTVQDMCGGQGRLLSPLEFKEAFHNFVCTLNLAPSSQLGIRRKTKTPLRIEKLLGFGTTFSYQFAPLSSTCEFIDEFFTETVIEEWLNAATCADCSQLIQKELLNLKYNKYDSPGNLIADIHRMLKRAETTLAEFDDIPIEGFAPWFDRMANRTLNSLRSLEGFKRSGHLFNSKQFGEVTHFTVMVKEMLRIFLRIRCCFLTRQEKIEIKPPLERSHSYSLRYSSWRSSA